MRMARKTLLPKKVEIKIYQIPSSEMRQRNSDTKSRRWWKIMSNYENEQNSLNLNGKEYEGNSDVHIIIIEDIEDLKQEGTGFRIYAILEINLKKVALVKKLNQ